MAAPLRTASITAPAFYGLNTTDSEVTLDPKFARVANNCIIDEGGRLGSRKGWQYAMQTNPVSTINLKGIHRFVDINGSEYFGAWSDDTFYVESPSGSGTLVEVTYNGSNTLTEGKWQAATLNDAAYLFQDNYKPIYFNPTTGVLDDVENADVTHAVSITNSGTTATVTQVNHYLVDGDTVTIAGANETEYNGTWTITVVNSETYEYTMSSSPSGNATGSPTATYTKGTPPEANTVLSAYGRLWVANTPSNKTTVYWSELLDGTEWRTASPTVGSLDISGILVYGNDEIVGLGAHNGRLIIFCKNNIIIMDDQTAGKQYLDPADMSLVEVINGIGCIARDSIVNTGTDILFLSESGVRALSRTIQEKSQPMRDISRNVRDQLVDEVSRVVDKSSIKGVYSESNGFYLLAIPTDTSVYCFDTKQVLPDGSARVTKWSGLDHTSWLAYDGKIYMTNTQGVAEYTGYQDNGNSYSMNYQTNYFDFGSQNIVKFLKNISATLIGSTGKSLTLNIYKDYEDIPYPPITLTLKEGNVFEYGIAEYGVAEYAGGALTENLKVPVTGSGFVIKLGIESEIDGGFLNIQQLNLYAKQGRLN